MIHVGKRSCEYETVDDGGYCSHCFRSLDYHILCLIGCLVVGVDNVAGADDVKEAGFR